MAQTIAAASQLASGILGRTGILGADVSALRPVAVSKSLNVVPLRIRAEQKNDSRTVQKAGAAAVALVAFAGAPGSAKAVDVDSVVKALTQVEELSSQAGEKAVVSYEYAKGLFEQFLEASKPVVEAATPILKQAAQKVVEIATPVAADVASKAKQALSDAGVDTAPVFEAARTAGEIAGGVSDQTGKALTVASPYAESTLETVLAQDPLILGVGAGSLVLLYLLAPTIFSSIAYSARGFAGQLTAAQTLDLLTTSDYLLVDVRTDKERSRTGTPALPRPAQKKRYSIPVEDLPGKLRGQLRNARKVEAELTAIKIAALKRLGKGSKIAILDANGSVAKLVARSLSNLGFRNIFVVKDGTDGSTGWVQSQLAMESFSGGQAEILSPSRVIPASRFGTRSSDVVDVPAGRRGFLLPGGAED